MHNEAVELAKRLLVDSIWKSALIEGLGTTFPKTEAILENIPTNTSREEVLFILNMRDAWRFLLNDSLEYPTNISVLREFNKIVGTNLFYGAGDIRSIDVTIGGTTWSPNIPNYADVVNYLHKLSQISDATLCALKSFCYIARTQIFIDGNKRVAQLVANKILIENNIGILQVPVNLMEDFKTKLLKYYETDDDSELIKFLENYCIVKIDTSSIKVSGEEPSFSVEKESFDLSLKQLNIFGKVLKNLIDLLKSIGESRCYLYEKDNTIYLEGRVVDIKIDSSTLKCKSNVIDGEEKLKVYVIKTVRLLQEHVPIPLKRISFTVSEEFTSGIIKNSEDEKGSSDVILRG